MVRSYERWRTLRTLRHYPIDKRVWRHLMMDVNLFRELSSMDRMRLRVLSTLFLRRKSLVSPDCGELSHEICVAIAAQACLLVLNLDLSFFRGWREVAVYESAFRSCEIEQDEAGVEHRGERVLDGESWLRGPVIVAWQTNAEELNRPFARSNVVIHEFAHKLDMLNGRANGMPPLHPNMSRAEWTRVFTDLFSALQSHKAHHQPLGLDEYALESPAEFFAVCSEYFFTAPRYLYRHFPDLYRQLAEFYRQNPLQARVLKESG